jgi:hypothetical protein
MTPDRTIEEINESLADGNEEWAFKLALRARDQLAHMLQNDDPGGDAWLLRSREITAGRHG